MNREKVIRQAYFEALNGNLVYNSIEIPLSDARLDYEGTDVSVYAVMTNQTAQRDLTYQNYIWNTTITIEIVSRFQSSVTKDVVDEVSEQIESIITQNNNPKIHGLTGIEGWKITHVFLDNISYPQENYIELADENIIGKTMVFSQRLTRA